MSLHEQVVDGLRRLLRRGTSNCLMVAAGDGFGQAAAVRGGTVVHLEVACPEDDFDLQGLLELGFEPGDVNPGCTVPAAELDRAAELLLHALEVAWGPPEGPVQVELDAWPVPEATGVSDCITAGLAADAATRDCLRGAWLWAPDAPPRPEGRPPLAVFTSKVRLQRVLGADTPTQAEPAVELFTEALAAEIPVVIDLEQGEALLGLDWLAWLVRGGDAPTTATAVTDAVRQALGRPRAQEVAPMGSATQLGLFSV